MSYYDGLKQFGNNPALIQEDGVSLTYTELAEEGARVAANTEPRSLVFCFCTNTTALFPTVTPQ